jgi:cytochrome c biogenesis protein CcdA
MATPFRYAIAFLPILMGVYRLGWIRLMLMTPKAFTVRSRRGVRNRLLLSLIIGPGGTPVLACVLSFAAYKQSFLYSGLLLFLYGVGNGLPLALGGTAAGGVLKGLDCCRHGNSMPLSAVLLILSGFYLLWRVRILKRLMRAGRVSKKGMCKENR